MINPPTKPVVKLSDMDCKGGNFLCKLGAMGCSSVQISGQPASHVAETQDTEVKCTNSVPVLGPGQYDLVIVGAEPSVEDDRLDMVWSDNSGGQILEFLRKAGHDLDRVWMTKITKCRPRAKGRKPTITESNTCRDNYLRKEIELIQPKVVMLVGAPAFRAFNLTGLGSVNAIHGRVFEARFARQEGMKDADLEAQPIYKVIPTLNPSTFFFRPNPKLQARVANDYRIAKNLMEGRELEPDFKPDYHLIDTPEKLEWLQEQLLSSNLIGWDTEQPAISFRKGPTISYQFAWGWDDCAVIPIMQHDPDAPEDQEFHLKSGFGSNNDDLLTKFMRKVFLTPHIAKAAHHEKFDMNVLRWDYGVEIEGFLYDTWSMKHLQDEQPPSNLAFLCDIEFGWGDYEAARREITGSGKKLKNTFDKVPDDILWQYGATDALGTYRLACIHAQRLQAKPNLWNFHTVESEPLQRSLARAEYHGALVHTEVMEILLEQFQTEQKSLITKMRGVTSNPDFNPMSPDQVLPAFLAMGVPIADLQEEKAASGLSAAKNKLNDIVERGVQPQADFAADVMAYRNKVKMISTYLENCREDLDTDGRVRYSWVIAGPVTGRLSCRFFHQIPKIDMDVVCYGKNGEYVPFKQRLKDKKLVMRDMFIAPEGYKYVYGDFSQIELRILALVSQDVEMLRILEDPNADLHGATTYEFLKNVYPGYTEEMARKDKFNRTETGKRVNFGLSYGSEGYSLVKTGKWKDHNGIEHNFTWDLLNNGMAAWKARFTGVGAFIDLTPDLVRSFGGIATNVFGRERHFGVLLNHPNKYERAAAEREAINFYIQSVSASITNRTIIAIDKMLEEFDISEDIVCLVGTVHDSLSYEVRDDHVEWFLEAMRVIAQQPYIELGSAMFKLDCGMGDTWSDAEMSA